MTSAENIIWSADSRAFRRVPVFLPDLSNDMWKSLFVLPLLFLPGPYFTIKICDLDGGKRRFIALIAGLCATAVYGLLKSVCRNDAENYRNAGLKRDLPDLCCLARNIIEMCRLTADDDTECDDSVETAAICDLFRGCRQLE